MDSVAADAIIGLCGERSEDAEIWVDLQTVYWNASRHERSNAMFVSSFVNSITTAARRPVVYAGRTRIFDRLT